MFRGQSHFLKDRKFYSDELVTIRVIELMMNELIYYSQDYFVSVGKESDMIQKSVYLNHQSDVTIQPDMDTTRLFSNVKTNLYQLLEYFLQVKVLKLAQSFIHSNHQQMRYLIERKTSSNGGLFIWLNKVVERKLVSACKTKRFSLH